MKYNKINSATNPEFIKGPPVPGSFYVSKIDKVAEGFKKGKGDKPYYQPILEEAISEKGGEIIDRKYAFRVNSKFDHKEGEDLKETVKRIIEEDGLKKIKDIFNSNNHKLTDEEVAEMLILASKHGSFEEAKKGVKEDLKKLHPSKVDDLYEKMYWFDAIFQKLMENEGIMTGRDASEPKFLDVGLRLARLTPDYAFRSYSKGYEGEDVAKGFNDLCKKLEVNFGPTRSDDVSDLSSSESNLTRASTLPSPSSSEESLGQSREENSPSTQTSPTDSQRLSRENSRSTGSL